MNNLHNIPTSPEAFLKSLKVLRSSHRFWTSVIIIVLLSLWLGVPTYRKWKADRLVDELYAKDGGVKVYETVELPADKFVDASPRLNIQPKQYVKANDEYYYIFEPTTYIIPENINFGGLNVIRTHSKLFRAKDNKLLAERIGYGRIGGDPMLIPVHPSSYRAGQNEISMEKMTFIKIQTGGIK